MLEIPADCAQVNISDRQINIQNCWKTYTKGKPQANPIFDTTEPTKSAKNPYQKQTESKTGKRVHANYESQWKSNAVD